MTLLLLSNSTNPGEPYLGWCAATIRELLPEAPPLFIPFAGVTLTWDDYTTRVSAGLGREVSGLHSAADPVGAIASAPAILIGGGNTFRLLERLRALSLLGPLRERARAVPVVGWSAGSNVCGPTIRTTNDMPIIDPGGFEALGLVPFQINPHFTRATLAGHGGESRAQRLAEFHALNPELPIAALPEATWLRVEGERVSVGGGPIEVLRADAPPATQVPGDALGLDLYPA